ncbi:hypothetical protein A6P39_002180 [Streptomyces sp. FXJ1.172]|nr:hypothetical protein [Streptomyces sp. FXJ1.172]WEP00495.1 hypothetical protein A6P39_002180 [Streptomyces sp. FXJ1.172]
MGWYRHITPAFGTGAGSLLVVALVGAATVAVEILGYRHARRPFSWMIKQTVVDNAKDLGGVTGRLEEIVDKFCEYAQKPCKPEGFTPLRKFRNLIKNFADQLEVMRPELNDVVKHFDAYLAMPDTLPATGSCAAQLEQAMERSMEVRTGSAARRRQCRPAEDASLEEGAVRHRPLTRAVTGGLDRMPSRPHVRQRITDQPCV